MTTKRKRIYEIIIFSLVIILTSLCAYMGITAVQKAMTLKMQFEVSPAVAVKLEIYNTDTSQWDLIFQNSGQGIIKDGITLSGNTLGFRSEYANGLGNEFTLKITSLSSSKILAEFGGASYSQSKLIFTDNTSQTVEVSAVESLTIDFSKVVQVFIQNSANGGLTLVSGNLVEFTQNQQTTYYARTHEALELAYDIKSSHKNHSIEATINNEGAGEMTTENNQMILSIPTTALTGDVSVTLSAEMNQLTVSYNGLTNINSSNTATKIEPNTLYTTTLTVTNESDYTLPETIIVKIGDDKSYVVPKNGSLEGITYNVQLKSVYNEEQSTTNYIFTGTLSIPESLTTGNIILEGAGYEDYWDETTPTALTTAGGSGIRSDPYLIANGEQLASMAWFFNTGQPIQIPGVEICFKLIKNIYLNEGDLVDENGTFIGNSNLLNQWEPIGKNSTYDFGGSWPGALFDGGGLTVYGIYINTADDYQGLFGHSNKSSNLGVGTVIQNIKIANSYINGGDNTGALIGVVHAGSGYMANILNVTIEKTVCINGTKNTGGVCGWAHNDNGQYVSYFDNCVNYAVVQGYDAGGICGRTNLGSSPERSLVFANCVNEGTITGANCAGGIVGYMEVWAISETSTYNNCSFNIGKPAKYCGGFVDID